MQRKCPFSCSSFPPSGLLATFISPFFLLVNPQLPVSSEYPVHDRSGNRPLQPWRPVARFHPTTTASRSASPHTDRGGRTLAPQPRGHVGARTRAGLHTAQNLARISCPLPDRNSGSRGSGRQRIRSCPAAQRPCGLGAANRGNVRRFRCGGPGRRGCAISVPSVPAPWRVHF